MMRSGMLYDPIQAQGQGHGGSKLVKMISKSNLRRHNHKSGMLLHGQ